MSPRDTQRHKVYAAEHSLFGWGQTIPNGDLQQTVQKKRKSEAALVQINRWISEGVVTKADLRRAADSTAVRRRAATKR